jgi:hypothetical protein
MSLDGEWCGMSNPLATRRGFWTFAILTWALAMLVGVIGVGVAVHASVGAYVFSACLLSAAVAFWCWVIWRWFVRRDDQA